MFWIIPYVCLINAILVSNAAMFRSFRIGIQTLVVPDKLQYTISFPCRSMLSCAMEWNQELSMMVAFQNGRCYYLTSHPEYGKTYSHVTVSSVIVKVTEPPDCVSKGYTMYPDLGVCIKYFGSSPTMWELAQKICERDGGYLINLNSAAKLNTTFSLTLVPVNYHINKYYFGGYGRAVRGDKVEHRWTRGGLIQAIWSPGEPNNYGKIEYCTGVISWRYEGVFGLNDFPCDLYIPFFCELLL